MSHFLKFPKGRNIDGTNNAAGIALILVTTVDDGKTIMLKTPWVGDRVGKH